MYIHRRTDSRVVRTKSAIRNAYLNLLAKKAPSCITMTDIALEADLDRKTIYNYYENAVSILDELENELVSSVSASLKEADYRRILQDPFGFLDAVTKAFRQHTELSDPLVHQNAQTHVFSKLAKSFSCRLESILVDHIQPQKQKYAKLYADFLTNGIASVYQDWIASGMVQPLTEIARQISLLIDHGMDSLL